MGWILYQLVLAAGLLIAAPFLLALRGRHYRQTLPGRLGRYPDPAQPPGGLWVHAVSVGEVAVAATLARSLPDSLPLIVTTVTPTGQKRARDAFDGRAEVTYLPFDFGFAVRRFLARYEPSAVVLVEGDYWPLVLRHARVRGLPVAVVNGRVSRKSFLRLHRLRGLAGQLFFDAIRRFGVQTAKDRDRLLALGVLADRVEVTGNLKYDSPDPPLLPGLEDALRRLAGGRPILVAGSTMKGEEEAVLEAFRILGPDRALLLLVPRHPERWDAVERLIRERDLPYVRRSRLDDGGQDGIGVVLLDSLGELASLYRIAGAAFIGGTLVPTGGHNPLEPARFAVPVVVGPSMHNFAEMAERFDRAGAWHRAADAGSLAGIWKSWIDEPDVAGEVGRRGAELLAANRGAVDRTIALLKPLIEAARGDRP